MSVQSGSVVSGRQRSPAPASASQPSGSAAPQADGNGKLEQQIVLRLPEKLAEEIRELVREQKLTPDLVWIHPIDARNFKFMVGKREFPATLVDLPCIIESQKTFDNSAYYKSADICQMLLVREPGDSQVPDVEFPSGLTPPTTRIRERRFRKPLYTKEEILKAEAQLLSILEGGPQIQYELVEEEVDVDEESAEESGDEWEDEDDEEEEDEEDKWRQSSVRSGTSATQFQNYTPSPGRFQRPTSEQVMASSPRRPTSMTPSFSQALPSASPSPMPIRPSTPGMDSIAAPRLGLSRTTSVPGSTPQRIQAASPSRASVEPSPARPMRALTPSQATPSVPPLPRVPSVVSRARVTPTPPATLSQPQASPLPPQVPSPPSAAGAPAPSPAPSPVPAAAQAAASTATLAPSEAAASSVPDEAKPAAQPTPEAEQEELSPEELQKQTEKKQIEEEIVALKERIVQINAKMQTANKILKKRYLKNIAEAEEELTKKNEALSAYN